MYAYQNMALTQMFAPGWELLNNFAYDATPDYKYIRDDRVYTYSDLPAAAEKRFLVHLNASFTGTYHLSLCKYEAMYNNSIKAYSQSTQVNIYQPGE